MRAVLLSNRAQCHLKIGQKHPDGVQSKEARKAFMKANMDASFASELAPDYSKALYRKGLSLLGMPDTNARSKEAVMAAVRSRSSDSSSSAASCSPDERRRVAAVVAARCVPPPCGSRSQQAVALEGL